MNGAQDLGGMHGFGPVIEELDEPVFHEEWEARVLGIVLALGALGLWNIDAGRHARESIPPVDYLRFSYYQIWLAGIEKLIERHALEDDTVNTLELSALKKVDVAGKLRSGGPADRPFATPARFKVGDVVMTRNFNVQTHTRLPRYLRGRQGRISRIHGNHVFPDDAAHMDTHNRGENPQWLYSVRFNANELWGHDKSSNDHVYADLWEPYFE